VSSYPLYEIILKTPNKLYKKFFLMNYNFFLMVSVRKEFN
jgi:hypothetical protein